MKKIFITLAVLLTFAACTKPNVLDQELFKDIEKPIWSCAHGAEGTRIEIKDNKLHIDYEISDNETYDIKHLEDMLFELKNNEKTKIMRLDPKTKGIHILEMTDNLESLKERPIDHECELIERIQS